MKIIKYILIILGILIALFLIVPLFLSNNYAVEKSITISRPKTQVFDYIKYLKNQNNYSKWGSMDTAMKKTFTGTDATPGFVAAWESDNKNVGKGAQEIKKINDTRIDYELRFEKPMKDVADAYMSADSVAIDKTLVKWQISGYMKYPFNIMGLFMDKIIGKDLEIGLQNLKKLQEQ